MRIKFYNKAHLKPQNLRYYIKNLRAPLCPGALVAKTFAPSWLVWKNSSAGNYSRQTIGHKLVSGSFSR